MPHRDPNRFSFRPPATRPSGQDSSTSVENTPRIGNPNVQAEARSSQSSPRAGSEAGSSGARSARTTSSRPTSSRPASSRPASSRSSGSLAAASSPAAQVLRLSDKILSDRASADQVTEFHHRFLSGTESQLPLYRQLRDLCERGDKDQARRLDFAMHPDLSRYKYRECFYPFLLYDRDGNDQDKDFGLGFDREDAAEKIRGNLIEKVIANSASPAEKELYRLKNEFDCLAMISPEQRTIYKMKGNLKAAIGFLNAQLLLSMEGVFDRIRTKHPAEAKTIRGVLDVTAEADDRVALHYKLMEDYDLNSELEHMIKFYSQLVDNPAEQEQGQRIARLWDRANKALIANVVQPRPKPEEVAEFGRRLDESASFQTQVTEDDHEYRTSDHYSGSVYGLQRCANLRYYVSTARLQDWVRKKMECSFPEDRRITPRLEKLRQDAAEKEAKEAAVAASAAAEPARSGKAKKKNKGKGVQGGEGQGQAQGQAQGGPSQGGQAQGSQGGQERQDPRAAQGPPKSKGPQEGKGAQQGNKSQDNNAGQGGKGTQQGQGSQDNKGAQEENKAPGPSFNPPKKAKNRGKKG